VRDSKLTTTIGEILVEEFIEPNNISLCKLASGIDLPVSDLISIIEGKKSIDMDISTKLGKYFGTSDEYFYNLDISCKNLK
jgi:addiction module HigA family antidote